MPNYPDIETDDSNYRAAIRYDDTEGWPTFAFPGGHTSFAMAASRARSLTAAIRTAGELGVSAYVVYSGERPDGFPRNGVKV